MEIVPFEPFRSKITPEQVEARRCPPPDTEEEKELQKTFTPEELNGHVITELNTPRTPFIKSKRVTRYNQYMGKQEEFFKKLEEHNKESSAQATLLDLKPHLSDDKVAEISKDVDDYIANKAPQSMETNIIKPSLWQIIKGYFR